MARRRATCAGRGTSRYATIGAGPQRAEPSRAGRNRSPGNTSGGGGGGPGDSLVARRRRRWRGPGRGNELPAGRRRADWAPIVADLDAARGRALAAADPALLAEVYLDGSAAARADAALIGELADRGWHVSAGLHEISRVTPVDAVSPRGSGDGSVRLSVLDRLPSRPIMDGSGTQVGMTPAREQQERLVLLARTPAGYRIAGITDP